MLFPSALTTFANGIAMTQSVYVLTIRLTTTTRAVNEPDLGSHASVPRAKAWMASNNALLVDL